MLEKEIPTAVAEDGEYIDAHGVKKHRLTPDQINELMQDWFVRDGDTFVKVTDTHKLGWEATKGAEAYSSFLTKGSDVNDILKKTYQLAYSFLVSMAVPKFALRISHNPKSGSYTDGKRVVVNTEVFKEESYDIGERIDVFIGLSVHEGCHLKYTDFAEYRMWSEMKKKIIAAIENVLEDERIEMKLADDFPGLLRFIEKTKYYYFDTKYLDNFEEVSDEEPFNKIMNIFLRIIRYPRYIDVEDIEYFGDYLWRIKEVLTPYPTSTKETVKAAIKIYDIVKELYKEKKVELLKASGEDGSGSEEGDEEVEFELTPEIEKAIEEELSKVELEVADKCKHVFAGYSEETDKEVTLPEIFDKHLPAILAGEYTRGIGETFILREKDNRSVYEMSLRNVKRFIPAIRKAISYHDKDYKVAYKSMRSGLLDTGKIVEAKQGVPTVYERFGTVKSDKMCICLLIDLSGSMSGSKIKAARETAILIYEALKDNHSIELFIYGHTADETATYSADIHVYSEPGYRPKYALGNVQAFTQNRDGDAIREAANRVRTFTQNKCLMFVIADGEPAAAGYSGWLGIADTKRAVKQAEKMNFEVCQITIESSYDSSKMFDHFIILDDLNSLAKDLGKFVKKQILSKQHISIT